MGRTFELDNRGLEPPQPMLRILNALENMAEDDILVARNDRQPLFLYPELQERGYAYRTEPAEDGGYRITIWKAGRKEP